MDKHPLRKACIKKLLTKQKNMLILWWLYKLILNQIPNQILDYERLRANKLSVQEAMYELIPDVWLFFEYMEFAGVMSYYDLNVFSRLINHIGIAFDRISSKKKTYFKVNWVLFLGAFAKEMPDLEKRLKSLELLD